MAVTKIWDVKGRLDKPISYVMNPEKTENPRFEESYLQALNDVIEYAADEEKTEQHYFVTAINCNITCARRQFANVKKSFDKEDGIIAYHGYQSFAPGEVSPQEAHVIGVELAQELWGDRFQVIVATHVNTACVHNHLLFNSVSFVDGKKYHDCRESYRHMREVSDRLCREHGLSVVEKPENTKDPAYLHRMDKAGMPTRYNMARAAIDEAISKSCNMKEFEIYLKQIGYKTQFNPRRKYWTVIPKGWEKPIRLARLGEEYTNQRILERVKENPSSVRLELFQKKTARPKQYVLFTRKDRINHIGGLRGLYLKYCYELGYLPRYRQNPNKVHYLLKDELMKCEKYSKQARLLGKCEIETEKELAFFIEKNEEKLRSLSSERDELRKISRRVMPEEERDKLKKQISEKTSEMKKLREEVKLCKDIETRSGVISEKLEKIRTEEERTKEGRSR